MKAQRPSPPSSCKPPPPCSLLCVWVTPGATRDQVIGFYGNRLKVKVRGPALEGKANAALLVFLASVLQLKPKQLSLHSGHKARVKLLHIVGLSEPMLHERIDEALKKS